MRSEKYRNTWQRNCYCFSALAYLKILFCASSEFYISEGKIFSESCGSSVVKKTCFFFYPEIFRWSVFRFSICRNNDFFCVESWKSLKRHIFQFVCDSDIVNGAFLRNDRRLYQRDMVVKVCVVGQNRLFHEVFVYHPVICCHNHAVRHFVHNHLCCGGKTFLFAIPSKGDESGVKFVVQPLGKFVSLHDISGKVCSSISVTFLRLIVKVKSRLVHLNLPVVRLIEALALAYCMAFSSLNIL